MATPEQKDHDRVVKIRSKHPLPDKALVAPGHGGWAAYFDGVIVAKCTPCFKPEAVLLQDIADIELQAPRGLRNGVLKITVGTAEANPKTINFNFLEDEKPAFVHLRDVLTAENQRGVTGELPPEYRNVVKEESSLELEQPAHAAPLMGISDEKFRTKYKIPVDAVLARAPGIGYISFDGHFVTIQHIGMQRGVVGKGVKRFPITGITNVHMKPAGTLLCLSSRVLGSG